jgi:hypothetical protein
MKAEGMEAKLQLSAKRGALPVRFMTQRQVSKHAA